MKKIIKVVEIGVIVGMAIAWSYALLHKTEKKDKIVDDEDEEFYEYFDKEIAEEFDMEDQKSREHIKQMLRENW